MKKNPSDPDIQTIYQRIKEQDLDLQPDFQRGEVWANPKKQRLIDSILRDWHVPPIHVIESSNGFQEVLDGQQRLATIRDFIENKLTVDGSVAPFDPTISELSGLTFSQLPADLKRKFNRYTLRVYTITEYKPGEPGELFFRLNQPTSLTSAETRNAFIGAPRDQVRALVKAAIGAGISRDSITMSPARMAYDDVVARFCTTLECGSLAEKIAANEVTARYRRGDGYSPQVTSRARLALELLGNSARLFPVPLRLNKATLHTWLVFLSSRRWNRHPSPEMIADYLSRFESSRSRLRGSAAAFELPLSIGAKLDDKIRTRALQAFNDRASSRVADVSSVIVRDAVAWLFWLKDCGITATTMTEVDNETLARIIAVLRDSSDEVYAKAMSETLEGCDWGKQL